MKVIEAIGEGPERRTYVEGGPECEGCEGKGYVGYTVNRFPHDVCHGTGLVPVELWPDAVKAEWLAKNYEAVWIHYGSAKEWSVTVLKEGAIHGGTVSHNADLSAALTAAVIAVAESEGK